MPDDVDARMLDPEARRELRGLTRESADLVARHLVVTGRTLDDDPVEALAHARAARAMAGRIGVVREAVGLAAYGAGEWAEALSELRAARRITGRPEHLAVLADCERALGRPERALAYADDPAVATLPQDERVELVIVLSGARRDLGQADAAVLTLQDPARRTTAARPWAARLWYAFADALLGAGREAEARDWFGRVAELDVDGATDAGDRLLELDGVLLEDLDEDEADGGGIGEEELAALVAEAFPSPGTSAEAPVSGPRTAGGPGQDADRETSADEGGSNGADAGTSASAETDSDEPGPGEAHSDGSGPGVLSHGATRPGEPNSDAQTTAAADLPSSPSAAGAGRDRGAGAGGDAARDEAPERRGLAPGTGRGPAFTAVEQPPTAPAPVASALMPTFASPPDAPAGALEDDDGDDPDEDDLTLFD